MPSPVTPSDFLETVPSNTGNFCEKFQKSLTLPKLVHDMVSYMYKEDGTFTDEFRADVCALDCFGGDGSGTDGGGTVTFGRPGNVAASDGIFNDKVRVTWSAVATATAYDIYRNAVNDSAGATLIASSATTEHEDSTAVSGSVYYYWVRARNATQLSGFSLPDTGYSSMALASVSDLQASHGFSSSSNPVVHLSFAPVAMATHYDFYISDTNNFSTATLLDSDRTPFDNQGTSLTGPPGSTKPVFINNQTDLVYWWKATTAQDTFAPKYFWVVAKTLDGTTLVNISNESNSALGWASGFGDGTIEVGGEAPLENLVDFTTDAGYTKLWFALHGPGGAGAGGDGDDAGGGGGGGAMAVGWIALNPAGGAKLRMSCTPSSDTARTAASTNGADGSSVMLQYSANGLFNDTVNLVSFGAPTGGEFSNGGLGAGGVGAIVVSVHASVNDSQVFDGNDGLPAKTGGVGGQGGHRFGSYRRRHATGVGSVGDGGSLGAGGGASKNTSLPSNAHGGRGQIGFGYLIYKV